MKVFKIDDSAALEIWAANSAEEALAAAQELCEGAWECGLGGVSELSPEEQAEVQVYDGDEYPTNKTPIGTVKDLFESRKHLNEPFYICGTEA